MKTLRINLLTSNLFVLGLITLLLNDLYLKYEFHNYITGKLSDFAGLFIFPFFLSAFYINQKVKIYISTFLGFVFWKLELSQFFIEFISNLTRLNIQRAVDYTDLFALGILPFSYLYFVNKTRENTKSNALLSIVVSFFSVYSFCATTVPRKSIDSDLKLNLTYKLPISKEDLISKMKAKHYRCHFTIRA